MPAVRSWADEVRVQLQRILGSAGFVRNPRLSRLIGYIIQKHLECKTEELKETVIGVEVFGRKPDYDPHRDSVVRTEAAKLRARLTEYYAGEGAADPVIIEIPKGAYVPAIRPASRSLDPAGRRRGWAAIVAAVLLVTGISAYWAMRQPRSGHRLAAPISVAVLPFANLSSEPSNEYFSDGLTEQIIDALANIEGLRVPARSSAFYFKGRRVDIHEIGSKLHADMVLEGTVRKEGEKVRITTTLSNVADGYTVWSRTYDRDMKDILALQDEIAQATVAALRVKIAFHRTPAHQTNDPQAYHLYLKGRYFQNLGASMVEAQKQAVAHFGQAIEKDPTYAVAYAALSEAWFNIGVQDPAQPPAAFWNAEAAARKALEIDDTLSDAHASLANVLVSKWYWQAAETELRRAIELNPNNARARIQYATSCLALTDRWNQALQEAERAQTLDWASPQVHGLFAMLLIGARQFDRAIALARKALEMNPNVIASQNILARAYAQKGMVAEAVAEFEKAERFGVRRSHWAAAWWAFMSNPVAGWRPRNSSRRGKSGLAGSSATRNLWQ